MSVDMTLDEALATIQEQDGRISELETWLGMLMVAIGHNTGLGYQLRVPAKNAAILRRKMPRGIVSIQIDYDAERDLYTLDAI